MSSLDLKRGLEMSTFPTKKAGEFSLRRQMWNGSRLCIHIDVFEIAAGGDVKTYQPSMVSGKSTTPSVCGIVQLCILRKSLNIFLKHAQVRGEYFYSVGVQGLQVIFFSSCRNIQFRVFCAEIFILWCIEQKYWSCIVTCYTAITIDYLDLNNVFGMLP